MIVCDLSTSNLIETYEKNTCLALPSVVSPLCSPTPPPTNSSGFKENLGLEPRPSYEILYLDLTFNPLVLACVQLTVKGGRRQVRRTIKNIVSLLWKHDFKIIKYFLTQSAIKIKNC